MSSPSLSPISNAANSKPFAEQMLALFTASFRSRTQTGTHELKFSRLLHSAREELPSFGGSVDAILSHWDFPTSILAPILSAEYGIPSPRLETLLTCEHKYWSRLEQSQVIPECVPPFDQFDPFDPEALSTIEVPYPFWVKPVKAHSSSLGFRVDDADGFKAAVQQICSASEAMGDAFNEVLAFRRCSQRGRCLFRHDVRG